MCTSEMFDVLEPVPASAAEEEDRAGLVLLCRALAETLQRPG